MADETLNTSGCKDKTAYLAIKNIRREEKQKLIAELKSVAEKRGYAIVNKIMLKEIQEDD